MQAAGRTVMQLEMSAIEICCTLKPYATKTPLQVLSLTRLTDVTRARDESGVGNHRGSSPSACEADRELWTREDHALERELWMIHAGKRANKQSGKGAWLVRAQRAVA